MTALYLEIGQASLKIRFHEAGMEFPLERQPSGLLTALCQERLIVSLQGFLKRQSWQPRLRALCAIGARGVSLRRMILPAASPDETKRLVHLQIESEFPLPPEDLAWGYLPLSRSGASQEVLVAAVKKEVVADYAQVLARCGVTPEFTLAALARASLLPAGIGNYAILDLGRSQSELLSFENGIPSSIRIVSWGGENLTRAISEKLQLSHDQAEKLKIESDQKPVSSAESSAQKAMSPAIADLALALKLNWIGRKLCLTGKTARCRDLAPQLAQSLGGQIPCERLDQVVADGTSAAILGLQKLAQKNSALLRLNGTKTEKSDPATSWQWAAAAGALTLAVILFPYAEALAFKPYYSKKVGAVKAATNTLDTIDRKWSFLQNLKQNQSPYLDTLFLMANGMAQGGRIESISMSRRGDVSLRGTLANAQQVTDFRSKLIESGLFATVSLEEQSPSPDRQKLAVRITAQWKPANVRPTIHVEPLKDEEKKKLEIAKNSHNAPPMEMPVTPPPVEMPAGAPVPANIKMPAGIQLPPGFKLPPGVQLAPGLHGKVHVSKPSSEKSSSSEEKSAPQPGEEGNQ